MKRYPAKTPEELKPLNDLVRVGKLFEVQEWIAAGKPVFYSSEYRRRSPLEIAARIGFHSMVQVFAEIWEDQATLDRALRRAVWENHPECAKLLVEKGADVNFVSLDSVAYTYDKELMELFLERGADIHECDGLANAISGRTYPLSGVYKKFRTRIPGFDVQLAKALKHFVTEEDLKWVSLSMWMGADPRLQVSDLREKVRGEEDTSAIEDAVERGNLKILKTMKLEPGKDDLNALLEFVYVKEDMHIAYYLLKLGADVNNKPNGGSILLERCLCTGRLRLTCDHDIDETYDSPQVKVVRDLISKGARLIPNDKYVVWEIRRVLAYSSSKDYREIINLLSSCTDQEIISKIIEYRKKHERKSKT